MTDQTQHVRVGTGVIIKKEDTVLLGKRKSNHGTGDWCFPGGYLELYETWEECAIRETKEEAGIHIKDVQFATATNNIFEKEGRHSITIFMVANYDHGKVQLMEPEKCEEWKWFPWNNLPNPLFIPIKELLKQGYSPFDS